jgi:hypothetical protein
MPKRVQRKRSKGWRMPAGAVYVGRPTIWGNPWRAGRDGTPVECVAKYRELVAEKNIWTEPNKRSIREHLAGKDLVCWCKPGQPCHADILLELANE